jgi:hypothetical protein
MIRPAFVARRTAQPFEEDQLIERDAEQRTDLQAQQVSRRG